MQQDSYIPYQCDLEMPRKIKHVFNILDEEEHK